ALGRCEGIGARCGLAIDADRAIVCRLRIEDRCKSSDVEVVGDGIGNIAGELVGLARGLRVEGEVEAVEFDAGDLAVLDALQRDVRVGKFAAASAGRRGAETQGAGEGVGGERTGGKLLELPNDGANDVGGGRRSWQRLDADGAGKIL